MRLLSLPVIAAVYLIQDVRITGRDNIPASGPAIFISNHTSHLDGFVIAVALYRSGIPPRFMAKRELFAQPLGSLLRSLGQIEIDRDAPGGVIEQMAGILDDGRSLIIFLEGTFTHDPAGWPMRAKTGIARLHEARPDVPIIPVSHWGNERIVHQWTGRVRWSRILHRSERVLLHFGPPVSLTGATYREQADSAMTVIAHEVARLRAELGRPMGSPPTERFEPDVLNHRLRTQARREARQAARAKRAARLQALGNAVNRFLGVTRSAASGEERPIRA
ncbi:lysophospholipid acyltransferase family protein [Flaviflexus huanghaiensis]|uniref:lysophospholipid acyltransferase family protein n=1 Tax=Flaviflexus huanghaiensis TaxID=1111473 RepID=UPI0015F83B56|nr:lysophospholipid acyltransferase family protein [Flaviflexus huanghaiensis]